MIYNEFTVYTVPMLSAWGASAYIKTDFGLLRMFDLNDASFSHIAPCSACCGAIVASDSKCMGCAKPSARSSMGTIWADESLDQQEMSATAIASHYADDPLQEVLFTAALMDDLRTLHTGCRASERQALKIYRSLPAAEINDSTLRRLMLEEFENWALNPKTRQSPRFRLEMTTIEELFPKRKPRGDDEFWPRSKKD